MNGVSQFLRVVLALTLIGGGLRVTGAVTSCVNDHLVEEDQSRFVAVEPQIPGEAHPLSASSFEATDIGHFAWDRSLGSGHLEFDGETAVWANSKAPGQGFRPPWVGASTLAVC